MHAISNSEDVPCTKWPPARRSKGVEKRRCVSAAHNTRTTPPGGGGRRLSGPETTVFANSFVAGTFSSVEFDALHSGGLRVRRGGPQQDGSTQVKWLVGGGWW